MTDIEKAFEITSNKGCRLTENGRYEANCSNHGRFVPLGTWNTLAEAREAISDYKYTRLVNNVGEYGLDIKDGKLYEGKYIAFPNGMIFNLHGNRMIGAINRDGYRHGIFNRKNVQVHRIIASLFCNKPDGKDFVNHIDGDKQNNSADNLEWCTKSENTKHSFQNGLQKYVDKSPVYTREEKEYIRNHCYDDPLSISKELGRNPETIRKYEYKYRRTIGND